MIYILKKKDALLGIQMANIWIDGKVFQTGKEENLLETILSLGFDLPYFCWHPALGSVGSCRQCAIRKYRNKDDVEGQIVMACMEPVLEDLHISIEEKGVREFRKNVIEWLMINHPHDCPICDEGGECHLQDMTVMAGHSYRRFAFKKRTHHNQDLGPCINHEMNRCIQCYRCVRFYNDYAGGEDLQVFAAHDHVYFGRHEDGTLESEFSGNLIEVCPTGVFTDKTLKNHYTRKWDLTSAPSVCHHCSLGCNILASERYGSLRRILSRFNSEVNGYFICDRGRFGYEYVNGEERVLHASIRKKNKIQILDKSDALFQLANIINKGKVMGIGSPRASLESNFALSALTGKENFYHGISQRENQLIQYALSFLQDGPVRTPTLKEIERYDAVIIIGEDVTNSAPMIDLAVKQSVLVQPLKKIEKIGIHSWDDAAAREFIQEEKGPLYILTPQKTKLDKIATTCFRNAPDNLTRLVCAIGHQLDKNIPFAGELNDKEIEAAREIATVLSKAERPLVITGTSLGSEAVLKSAINLANALHKKNSNAGITFVFSECNSLGMGIMEKKCLSDAVESDDQCDVLFILENDLFRRLPTAVLEKFLDKFKKIVVLDHTQSRTNSKADLVLPAGTFAEADGTLVNNEGRAQRFFRVQAAGEDVQESWRWICQAGELIGNKTMKDWHIPDDVIQAIEKEFDLFKGISKAAPPADYRINGQKIARAPHRYSGRTAMFADHKVSEARPPKDPDSPLSYTMEGYRGIPPASATPFYWSPGWNSAQAINKFRIEIDGPMQEKDSGIRLIEPSKERQGYYLVDISDHTRIKGKWNLVPLHHIFGSEELSMKSQAISERSPGPSLTMNEEEANKLRIVEGEEIIVMMDDLEITLPIKTETNWPEGSLGISAGFPRTSHIDTNSLVTLKKLKEE